MSPSLTDEVARVVVEERVEAAERFRRRREARRAAGAEPDAYDAVTVRLARADDERALRRLAERDGRSAPAAPLLVAEADGVLLAARSLADGGSVADPFRHTAHLVELLALRTAHLRGQAAKPSRGRIRGRLRLAAAWLSRHHAANPHGGRQPAPHS